MQAHVSADIFNLDATREVIPSADATTREWPETFDEAAVTERYKAKAKRYYRCMTCTSQPVREQSHFCQMRRGKNTRQCRRQRLTDTEAAEWVAEHVNALRVQYKDARERGITDIEISEWYETKVRNYYRCITCSSQPVRERSHFQRRPGKSSTKPCRRQRLTRTEEAAWITTRKTTLRSASAEAHRIIAKRLKSSQSLIVKTCDKAQQNVCNICTKKFPGVALRIGQHCCAACHRSFELVTPGQRSNHRQNPDRALVCAACRANGYHPRDLCTYECSTCNGLLGRKNFSPGAIHAFMQRKRGNLTCRRCSASGASDTTTAQQNANPKRKVREVGPRNRVDSRGNRAAFSPTTPIIADKTCGRSAAGSAKEATTARQNAIPKHKLREWTALTGEDYPGDGAALSITTPLLAEIRSQ